VNNIEIFTLPEQTIGPNGGLLQHISCGEGNRVLSGGMRTSNAPAAPTNLQVYILESFPLDSTTWRVSAFNPAGAPSSVPMQAYVVCLISP
jgi:hypothetical protein